MYISIDKSAKRTYTRQIYYSLWQKILSGEITVGEALPPYRELSRELAVSKNTVLAAYDMLASDGVVRGVAGSGFYVETGMARMPAASPAAELQSAALSDTVIHEGTVNFDNGLPALELFPRAKWNKVVSAALMYAPDSALGYDQPQGRGELRSVLCDYLRRTQGINCGSGQIIITSGAKQAISLAAGLLLAGGGEAWIEDPSTVILKRLLACHTERIVPLPVDEYGLDPAGFPAGGKPALIFAAPSRQFPMGGIMPMTRRIELICRARSAGAYVIEDNFENEFRYGCASGSLALRARPGECDLRRNLQQGALPVRAPWVYDSPAKACHGDMRAQAPVRPSHELGLSARAGIVYRHWRA